MYPNILSKVEGDWKFIGRRDPNRNNYIRWGTTKKIAIKGNQWFNLSLKIWQETIKLCRLEVPAKLLKWCAYDTNFLPNRSDDRFKKWTTKGLTSYFTFFHKGAFQNFGSLQEKHELEKNDFFRYLQVRHYFNQNLTAALEPEELGILKLVLSASKSTTCSKIISKLYKAILQCKSENSLYIKKKWEKEGNFNISDENWQRICAIQWSSTSFSMWREFCWKNIVRFFITPQQKAHFGEGSSCWRLCGENNANHFHIFWSCRILVPYWQEIHKHVNNVFDSSIPLSMYSVLWGLSTLNQSDQILIDATLCLKWGWHN